MADQDWIDIPKVINSNNLDLEEEQEKAIAAEPKDENVDVDPLEALIKFHKERMGGVNKKRKRGVDFNSSVKGGSFRNNNFGNSRSNNRNNNHNHTNNNKGVKPCKTCGKVHWGVCRYRTTTCFKCGQKGHIVKQCPQIHRIRCFHCGSTSPKARFYPKFHNQVKRYLPRLD